jgi:hypothetical protein
MQLIIILFSLLIGGTVPLIGDQNEGKIYFMRHSGQGKIGQSFIYIDDSQVCALSNHKYFSREISPGTHTFRIQSGSNVSKAGIIKIDIEPGKSYYFYATTDVAFGKSNLILLEITEASATKLMSEFEKDNCN